MHNTGMSQGGRGGGGRNEPRPGPVPAPFGRLLQLPYRLGLWSRSRSFDRGKGVVRINRPVISVGNLSVGGTGKTPMVAKIVTELRAMGRDPAIAMRGYGATKENGSDEAAVYTRQFEDLPIVAQPNRLAGLLQMFGTDRGERVSAVVLDDGFQHRRIARDLDIVLIDATRSPFEDELLPAGWLREPVAALRRAGLIGITHAESVDQIAVRDLERRFAEAAPHAPVIICRHTWTGLLGADGPPQPSSALRGRRVVASCGIGNPDAFIRMLREAIGGEPVGVQILQDHDAYRPDTVERLVRLAKEARADLIIVTEKDWAKLAAVPPETWPCPVVRPVLEMRIDRGEDVLRKRLEAALAAGDADGHSLPA